MIDHNTMNPYEQKGIDFLNKIDYLVKRKDLKTKDSLFKVLDHIVLRKDCHLQLKVANQIGMGDESYFYSYFGNEDPFKGDLHYSCIENTPTEMFHQLIVEPSEMGAWQAYLLFISPTLLPLYWHGGYIRREYFFDRENFECPIPMWDEKPINLALEKIPQPSVKMEDDKAIVSCPYWNHWEGLVLESMPIIFKADGSISFRRARHKVLYKYYCGICF